MIISLGGEVIMRLNMHIMMGYNQGSIGPAAYLQQQNEIVYVCVGNVKGVQKQNDFILVDQRFIDSIDHILFKVFIYEPPYKKARTLIATKSFILEKNVPEQDDSF